MRIWSSLVILAFDKTYRKLVHGFGKGWSSLHGKSTARRGIYLTPTSKEKKFGMAHFKQTYIEGLILENQLNSISF